MSQSRITFSVIITKIHSEVLKEKNHLYFLSQYCKKNNVMILMEIMKLISIAK